MHVLRRGGGQDGSELRHVMFGGGVGTRWKDFSQVEDTWQWKQRAKGVKETTSLLRIVSIMSPNLVKNTSRF